MLQTLTLLSAPMIYLHKILPLLVSPLAIAFAVIVYGANRSRKKLVYLAIALLYILSTPIAANYIFSHVEGPAFRQDPAMVPNADAIVVLSGMLNAVKSPNGVVYEWMDADRFFAGVELFKLEKSSKLIFTGGRLPWSKQLETEGNVLERNAVSLGVPASQIHVTDEVKNTEEEAIAVRRLLPKDGHSVLLVTSAFHMPRSAALFEAQGLSVIQYPVDFHVVMPDLTPMDFLTNADSLALTSLAWREQIGRVYYWLKAHL